MKDADNRKRVFISISIYGKVLPNIILEWFYSFQLFSYTRMGIDANYKKYNDKIFKEAINSNVYNSFHLEDRSYNVIRCHNDSTTSFEMKLSTDLWEENKHTLISKIENVFSETKACFAFVVNMFDDYVVQNPSSIDIYQIYGVDDSDFQGVLNIPIVPNEWKHLPPRIDPSYLPGHRVVIRNMNFTVAPYMWFGPNFEKFSLYKKIVSYKGCIENTEFLPGYRRICLWEDIKEYNNPIYRKYQHKFKKTIFKDELIKKFDKTVYSETLPTDSHILIQQEKTENSNVLTIDFYLNEKGESCKQSQAAYHVKRIMDDNNNILSQTVYKINN